MGIKYLETVVLSILKRINGERTIYSLFHLFQGKRSSQTIQDAHLYKITPYFHTYPSVTRDGLEKMINRLQHRELVEEIAEKKVILTEKGEETLNLGLSEYSFPEYLNGWKYHQVTDYFWERLTLLIQVSSNLINHERSFIPVRNKRETLIWVKQYIKQQNEDRYKLAERLYGELISALNNEKTRPELVVLRLTGFKKIGLTTMQAAEFTGLEPARYHFEFLNCLHAMFDRVLENEQAYPLLNGLIKKAERNVPLTISTDKTYKLMQKGYNLEEISAARNLKQSTIEDHVVEIALSIKEFNIDGYILQNKKERILQAAQRNSAKKLKQIKEQVTDASYFEIRLVLAKYGDMEWS
ncbi:RQC domain-containing protein [Mesobacillus boroniphilus]|uniref:RQC domain-containing protein n=1 Tax=Mesobacillus boroniphilus TaxID=308892 RepID=A0A944CKF9_9BACI|nr:helix-turn-helix domain-containing protein [Mesobacillus boroniphilus]MBS8264731.1 RQC domain-containing protein [Mesobacillus boroniphilus]